MGSRGTSITSSWGARRHLGRPRRGRSSSGSEYLTTRSTNRASGPSAYHVQKENIAVCLEGVGLTRQVPRMQRGTEDVQREGDGLTAREARLKWLEREMRSLQEMLAEKHGSPHKPSEYWSQPCEPPGSRRSGATSKEEVGVGWWKRKLRIA